MANLSISENGIGFIKKEEGTVLHAYKDQAGVVTIGIGSTRYKDGTKPKMGDTITQDQADELLKFEVDNKTAAIRGLLGNTPLNQNQMDAIISFAYNVGIGGFADSTLLKRIKINPSDPFIRNAFMMWNKITVKGKKVVNAGLNERRKREADLYFSD